MPQVVIENLVLNSPFGEPKRHFNFTEDGITDEIVEERRISQYFVPIPRAKKKAPSSFSLERNGPQTGSKKTRISIEFARAWRNGGRVDM